MVRRQEQEPEAPDQEEPTSAPADPGVLGEAPDAQPGTVEDGTTVPMEPSVSAVHRLEEQLDESKDRLLRLAAEYDNFRKRVARERADLAERAQAALATRLLDVMDDLDRLTDQDVTQTSTEVMHEALELLDRKLRKELTQAGLERIAAEGAPFDPALHEAVATVPTDDPARDQHVAAVFQPGYLFKGTLIRPARVQVQVRSTEG